MTLTARDIMESHVVRVSPLDPLSVVHRLFFEEDINGAPVVDEEDRVVGVITSKDLLRAASDEHDTARGDPGYFRELLEFSGPDWDNAPEGYLDRLRERAVEDYMTEEAVAVAPDAAIPEIARLLRANGVHRVLVIDEGRLAGIISTFDMVALLEKADPKG
jgi:CBS domain-containing protein